MSVNWALIAILAEGAKRDHLLIILVNTCYLIFACYSHPLGGSQICLSFIVCAYSNGGAIAFEAGIAYAFCKSVLWVASVPVLSQQHRSAELKCPVGFLHGTRDRYYFGGHDAVKIVAEKCAGHWSEYDGGHSDCSESLAYTELMQLS